MQLYGFEMSLATAPLDSLEAVARSVTKDRLRQWFDAFPRTQEAALLSTCHRVEIALVVNSSADIDRWRDALPGPAELWRVREGRAVVQHVFRVAAGLESLAHGEAEARLQVRAAARRILSRHPRPLLREVFRQASEDAEPAPPSASRPPPSIGAVAVHHLLAWAGKSRPRVVVVGSGSVGRQVTELLTGRAFVTMMFHGRPPPESFLALTGSRAAKLDRLAEALAGADVVVTAAKFGDRGLRVADLPGQSLLLIDLGMPRNIDPTVRTLPNVRLIDLEELYDEADLAPPPPHAGARSLRRADRCADGIERLLLEPWIAKLRRRVEDVRRRELARARPFLGSLDDPQRAAVEQLTRRLVDQLFLPPTQRIRELPPGPEGDARRRWAHELFRALSPGP